MAILSLSTLVRVAAFGMGLGCAMASPPAQAESAASHADLQCGLTPYVQLADGEGGAPTHDVPRPQFT